MRCCLLIVALVAFGSPAQAGSTTCPNKGPCVEPTAWNTAFDTFDIEVSRDKSGDYAHWRIEASSTTHDTTITVEQATAGKPLRGTLAMIGGKVLITNGLELEPGHEIDAVDGPFLYVLLAGRLLGRAFPDGPESLADSQRINLTELHDGLQVATPSASADFRAPWTVAGTATKDRSGPVRFDLHFTFAMPTGADSPNFTLHLTGTFEHGAGDPGLRDDMPLQDWKVYGVGPTSRKQGNATILDYGATADHQSYATVGEVRASLTQQSSPGARDVAHDFSGFWKESCEHNFGLRIKPIEPLGMYSVAFCGPGGCDAHGQETFISGDRRYEVVSQDEIKQRDASGWSIYRKCSADPNATPKR
jgi:hypothetical protein